MLGCLSSQSHLESSWSLSWSGSRSVGVSLLVSDVSGISVLVTLENCFVYILLVRLGSAGALWDRQLWGLLGFCVNVWAGGFP